jgi:hypothetical protein
VALAQTLAEKKFYPYQVELTFRIVESLLLHDGDIITALFARQSGKSESVGAISAAIAIILPHLAKQYPESWMLNITDDKGVYRGYVFGVKIGIYAPKQDQAAILFDRVKKALTTDTAKKILQELHITFDVRNGNTLKLSNGSRLLCESASEQAKIEGETHHFVAADESQEISDMKMRKSIQPMLASTNGTLVKIGTATTQKCDFYTSIKVNERLELVTGKKNHFFYPYQVVQQYNSLYKKHIEKEKIQMGEESDEFQTSYCGRWIFERGMFVTQEQLFNKFVAQVSGLWSLRYDSMLPRGLRNYRVVAGIDWGSSHDSTVLTLVAVDWTHPADTGVVGYNNDFEDNPNRYTFYNKHVIGWLEFVGDNYEHQFGEVMEYLGRIPQLAKVVTDSNTCGKPIYDRLVAAFAGKKVEIEPFNFQVKIKSDGYKSLYADICGRRFTFPASPEVRRTREYQKFVGQMLDLRKEYKQNLMHVAHPDEKGAHDDFCIMGSSLVITRRGEIPIKDVVAGDEVLTRKGWKRVLVSCQTGESEVIRKGNLVATANHPFYCVNKNTFIPLAELGLEDTILSCVSYSDSPIGKSEPSSVSDTTDTGGLKLAPRANTFCGRTTSSTRYSSCTAKFGDTIKKRFQKAVSFTTKMVTLATTALRTWSASLLPSTQLSTCATLKGWPAIEKQSSLPKELPEILLTGNQQRQEPVSVLKRAKHGISSLIARLFAKSAVASSKPETTLILKLVPVTVQHAAGDASTLKEFKRLMPGEKVPVYNLTVEDTHEFVCQGVVVHNCDSAMLACWGASSPSRMNRIDFLQHNPFY